MGCKKVMVKIGKSILQELTPPGLKLLTTIVQIVSTTDWSNGEKRNMSLELGKAALKAAGIEAKENAIRATNELILRGLKKLGAGEMEVVGELTVEEADAEETVTL